MTVWVYLKDYGQAIIDNNSIENSSEKGYFWIINDHGYQVFMTGDSQNNNCRDNNG